MIPNIKGVGNGDRLRKDLVMEWNGIGVNLSLELSLFRIFGVKRWSSQLG